MFSVTDPSTFRETLYALCLELLFLSFCVILIGYARAEIRRQQNIWRNRALMILSMLLMGLSFFVTKLFIQG